jgi:sugar phosphate permease
MVYNRFLGTLLTIFGIIILTMTLGEFVLRIMIALFALWLINYGLRMQGQPPLVVHITRWRQSFWF